ncbi:hypothetical protein J9978_04315 [Chromobacterium violaceum]|uniref:hypothetical protein n=2 Tax=Chromobacterium violaceum TaxID=536 RepID=UPI0009DA5A51|nr:hypothetical protein [Chromobacterium violaceum]MBP4048719.1 hypothetical protein [Chromobacterium violaceum]MBT2868275.1 hypothetical protein [Chromobacterium violaceum]OQS26906.1 hypothetical protein B0T41_10585 [Chromobacterium violaceum]
MTFWVIKMKYGVLAALAAVFLMTGCEEKAKVESCWDADAKATVKGIFADSIVNIVKSNSQADEASIRKALTVDLKNFMAVDINSIGAATCNADVEVVVKRDDGHKVSASAADVLFGIYPAEGGKKMYQVKDFSKLVNLVKDLDAAATGGQQVAQEDATSGATEESVQQ